VSAAKPPVVRFYLDADVLGLAYVVAALRNDATYPGDPGAIIKMARAPSLPVGGDRGRGPCAQRRGRCGLAPVERR
jgi:hypothetical protein